MAKFLLIYHGGKMPETEEEGAAAMAAWGAWYEELGAATVDPGAPVGKSHTVSADGHVDNGGSNPVSGYTVLECASMEEACAAAAKNPMAKDGHGSVEVAPMIDM